IAIFVVRVQGSNSEKANQYGMVCFYFFLFPASSISDRLKNTLEPILWYFINPRFLQSVSVTLETFNIRHTSSDLIKASWDGLVLGGISNSSLITLISSFFNSSIGMGINATLCILYCF